MRSLAAGAIAALVLIASAQADDLEGRFRVEGTSPNGGGSYSGTVSGKATGKATYQVVWVIGDDKFVGTGIGGPDGLAVAYESGSNTGIAIYSRTRRGDFDATGPIRAAQRSAKSAGRRAEAQGRGPFGRLVDARTRLTLGDLPFRGGIARSETIDA